MYSFNELGGSESDDSSKDHEEEGGKGGGPPIAILHWGVICSRNNESRLI